MTGFKRASILVSIILVSAFSIVAIGALARAQDRKTVEPAVYQHEASTRPVVNVSLYAGEISLSEYGFGNSSSGLTSPGPILHFRAGDAVNITVYNAGTIPHAWELRDSLAHDAPLIFNAHVGSADFPLAPGMNGSDIFLVTQTGHFFYVCPIPGHVDLGMWGEVIVNSTDRVPGISAGQFLHYSINVTATGNDTELLTHLALQTAWGNVTILSVKNDSVVFQEVFYNATVTQSTTVMQNLTSGSQNTSLAQLPTYFIDANLTEGDPIYTGGLVVPLTINETIPAIYLSQQIEANCLYTSRTEIVDMYGYMINRTLTAQVYWERKTGIMLDYHIEQYTNRSNGAGGILITRGEARVLILTAEPLLPVIPELPYPIILLVLMAATLPTVIGFRKRLWKRANIIQECH